MNINLLDLFSGIGGFHLGLSQAGFKVNSYYSEIDKYAIKTYNHNFKNSTYVGSVTDVRGAELPRINAITFGSPCQDFSLAGKRKGMEGNRSSLILEAIRLIEECRPDFFIWENVKGTFSSNNRQDFAAILQAFTNIGGYRLEWQLLNTSWFLPQNRERIYLVGYTPNRSRGQVFPIGEVNKKNDSKTRTANRQKKDTQIENIQSITKRVGYSWNDDIYIQVKSATKKGYEIAAPGDSVNLSQPNSKTRRGRVGKQQAQTLETSCNQAVVNPVQIGQSKKTFAYKNGTMIGKDSQDAFTIRSSNPNGVKTENRIRRLTPIECERLQGFPDNWTLAEDNSDTQRYKMCGNAVTVDVVKAVGERIIKTLYWI